jgi:NTP pyrophosphatase (non-canonical NTP hydrolase)
MRWEEIEQARARAHQKHGDNSIESEPNGSPRWLPILVEEIGEVANALTYDGPAGSLRAELIDVIAVASAWVDAIDLANTRLMCGTGVNSPADGWLECCLFDGHPKVGRFGHIAASGITFDTPGF